MSGSAATRTVPQDVKLPIVYCRGFAGASAQIDTTVDDPFYGFNDGATHVRINGDGDPRFYQFEGPLLRLIDEHGYKVIVRGSQTEILDEADDGSLDSATVWISRFYDSVATTWAPDESADEVNPGLGSRFAEDLHRAETVVQNVLRKVPAHLTANGFDIEAAATQLYDLITEVLRATGAPQVYLVAHSMGGLVARCMMQKICETTGTQDPRRHAKDIVAKFFTYATPHGGIDFTGGALNAAMEEFGPIGSDMFSPAKMYGYLTPGKTFGDTPPSGPDWDPQEIPADLFDPTNIFCLIGTDQKDFSFSKYFVGPQSDGLVQIQHAYVRKAHRAFVYKSHSGRYGEVNSEEGYQNLSRFLFGKWSVKVELIGLPSVQDPGNVTWQADLQLAIRGLSVLMTEQTAAHYCPIQLSLEATGAKDSVASPVPLVETFLLSNEPPADVAPTLVTVAGDAGVAAPEPGELAEITAASPAVGPAGPLSRYALSLKVYQTATNPKSGSFNFTNNLEQVGDWSDVLIVDVGTPTGGAFGVWTGWNSGIDGAIDGQTRMSDPLTFDLDGTTKVGTVSLPTPASQLAIFGSAAKLQITVTPRY